MGLFPIAIYLGLCVLVGVRGMQTQIGFWGTMLLSVVITPLVVFIALVVFEGQPRRSA
jgi:uncharacterized membrane protein